MWDLLEVFLNSNDSFIKATALQLNTYKQQLDLKQISSSEFKDLANDVLDMGSIQNSVVDLDRITAIQEAYTQMLNIVEAIPVP